MFGLADRLAKAEVDPTASVVELPSRTTVMLIDHDPMMLQIARRALEDVAHIVIAANAREVLIELRTVRPSVLLVDCDLRPGDAELLAWGVPEGVPVITIDPAEPIAVEQLRDRVKRAVSVGQRVWMTGGLRKRVAA